MHSDSEGEWVPGVSGRAEPVGQAGGGRGGAGHSPCWMPCHLYADVAAAAVCVDEVHAGCRIQRPEEKNNAEVNHKNAFIQVNSYRNI